MGKGIVSFKEERCKGCQLCVKFCPVHIIALNKDKVNNKGYTPAGILNMDKCVACKNCETICPDLVISVEKI